MTELDHSWVSSKYSFFTIDISQYFFVFQSLLVINQPFKSDWSLVDFESWVASIIDPFVHVADDLVVF